MHEDTALGDDAALLPGPDSFEGVLAWARSNIEGLSRHDAVHGTRFAVELKAKMDTGVIMTTSYSGQGTAEACGPQVQDACAGRTGFTVHSACDYNRIARKALLAHSCRSAPAHVFEDIMRRVHPDCAEQLVSLQRRLQAQLQSQCAGQRTTKKFREAVTRLGEEMAQEAGKILDAACFLEQAPCARGGQHCCLKPARAGRLWVELAGVTCTAFSNFGSKLRWVDPSAVPCLVWCYWCRPTAPDIILVECVSEFEAACLEAILSDYAFLKVIFCPTTLGIPSRRKRFYGAFVNKRSLAIDSGLPAEDTSFLFHSIFARSLRLDGGIYLRANEDTMLRYWQHCAAQRGLEVSEHDLARMNRSALLDPAHRVRLQGYIAEAQRHGISDSDHLFCNVMQTVGFVNCSARHRGLFPTLMRNSVLVDCGRQAGGGRPVHPLEHYAAMGFPVLLPPEAVANAYCPFPQLLDLSAPESLTFREMRHLTGNGMHCAAVGTWLQLVLAITRSQGDPAGPAGRPRWSAGGGGEVRRPRKCPLGLPEPPWPEVQGRLVAPPASGCEQRRTDPGGALLSATSRDAGGGGCCRGEARLAKAACPRICGRLLDEGDICQEPCNLAESHEAPHGFGCTHTLPPPMPMRPPPQDGHRRRWRTRTGTGAPPLAVLPQTPCRAHAGPISTSSAAQRLSTRCTVDSAAPTVPALW